MKSSLLSLRRSPSKILEAIENREEVVLTRRGKPLARIVPLGANEGGKASAQQAFGMWRDAGEMTVGEQVRGLRRGRHHDL